MKLDAFRIRPLPGGDYLHCICLLTQSSPVLGSCSWLYTIVTTKLVLIFFDLQVKGQYAFSICQQYPFVQIMKQDKNCSSSECISRNTVQDVCMNGSRRWTFPLFYFTVEIYFTWKSIDAKCFLFVTLNFLFLWSKHHLHEVILNYSALKLFCPKNPFWLCNLWLCAIEFLMGRLALLKHCLYHLLQLNNKKALSGENNFTDTMRHMLSSRLSMPDCPNCNYRRRWADVFSMKS